MTVRSMRTAAFASREELADALASLFVAELLLPSRPLWIVTPWISDVRLIDNRSGRFRGLVPTMAKRWLRLGEVLELHLARGGGVVVACRPDVHNLAFVDQIRGRAQSIGAERQLRVRESAELHEKGILADEVLLSGSMNLTYNGLRRLEESVHLNRDPDTVARTRAAYKERWGEPQWT